MLRDAPDHAVRAAPHRWYNRSGSRFRKRPSQFPYRWELSLRAAQNHGSARAAHDKWYSCSRSGCSLRKHPSRFPYRWGLLLRAAPEHGCLGLFRRIPHHTPHRPLWRCRLLCHRCRVLRYQLRRSCCACICGCACRRRWTSTRPSRDRECRIPRRIRHRFCLWCRWGFRCRRSAPHTGNTKRPRGRNGCTYKGRSAYCRVQNTRLTCEFDPRFDMAWLLAPEAPPLRADRRQKG